jgi:hypothetical protein
VTDIVCEVCRATFTVRPYRATTARFCSRRCGGAWHAKQRFVGAPRPWVREALTTHGMSKTPTYRAWHEMNRRCADPARDNYPRYGGAGVTVAEVWRAPHGFEAFFAAMGERPSKDHSVDRIRRTEPYGPGNARWATDAEQRRNRSDNVWLTFQGRTMVLADWAAARGMKTGTLWMRLKLGWSTERALTEPVGRRAA